MVGLGYGGFGIARRPFHGEATVGLIDFTLPIFGSVLDGDLFAI